MIIRYNYCNETDNNMNCVECFVAMMHFWVLMEFPHSDEDNQHAYASLPHWYKLFQRLMLIEKESGLVL